MNKIGVLALQGDVIEHLNALSTIGADPVKVRTVQDLSKVDGLIIPGGESTVISKLLNVFELRKPLIDAVNAGLGIYGTCAGMIMVSKTLSPSDPKVDPLNFIDLEVRRNAFGRQNESFETNLKVDELGKEPVRAVFIRAPIAIKAGKDVEVLAKISEDRIVAARYKKILVTAFHPEMTGDYRFHEYFLKIIKN